ncbi:unnamed protein product [Protopolystoma xenopodis]|uniref:Uncharacterized protein n=1 Tax=Protopolystoma xenopodis TaxID=117903 RepID=A0A448WA82_9PLAT|nr:unnamed protein product [Protopolystoma xenopodis]
MNKSVHGEPTNSRLGHIFCASIHTTMFMTFLCPSLVCCGNFNFLWKRMIKRFLGNSDQKTPADLHCTEVVWYQYDVLADAVHETSSNVSAKMC